MDLIGHKCFACRKGSLSAYGPGALHQSGQQYLPTTIYKCGECAAATWAPNTGSVAWKTWPKNDKGDFVHFGEAFNERDFE